MTPRFCLIIAGLSGMSAVTLGAFGSHALQGWLPHGLLKAWHTAVEYQFIHTLALLAVGMLLAQSPATSSLKIAAIAFSAGILLFCGSLYGLALTQIGKLGMITPLGGISFIIGWSSLIKAGWQWRQTPD